MSDLRCPVVTWRNHLLAGASSGGAVATFPASTVVSFVPSVVTALAPSEPVRIKISHTCPQTPPTPLVTPTVTLTENSPQNLDKTPHLTL